MGLSFSSQYYRGTKYAEYSLNLPFKVSGAPEDDNKKASANIYYSQDGYVMLENQDEANGYVWYRVIDPEAKKQAEITTQSVTNWRHVRDYTGAYVDVSESLPEKHGTSPKITLEPDHDYEFNVDAELAFTAGQSWLSTAYGYASLDLVWTMQVVYTNTYDIIE